MNKSLYFGLYIWICLLLVACHPTVPELKPQHLENEVHRLTNVHRETLGLPPLKPLSQLKNIARAHSLDMVRRQYFEHNSPEGQTPESRLSTGYAEAVIMYSGENLAQHSQDGLDATQLAEELLRLWKASPDHAPQLIAPEFAYLGVGAAQDEKGVVYVTQTFAGLVAQLLTPIPAEVNTHDSLNLRFEFLAPFASPDLSAFLHTRNGKGPIPVRWEDHQHFQVRIPTERGPGQYRLRLGQGARFFEKDYTVQVR